MVEAQWEEWLRAWRERWDMAREEAVSRWVMRELENSRWADDACPDEYLFWAQPLEWELLDLDARAWDEAECEDERRRQRLHELETG